MGSYTYLAAAGIVAASLAGCTAGQHARDVREADDAGQRLTVGNVQRSITKGMSGGQVVEALGSPNIVSTDEHGREVWIYDRFATEVVASTSSSGWFFVIGGASQSSGASRTSQRSLTVIVKFYEAKAVRDVAYHSSSF
jgi:outer membrane protein assembly factor BamE (lipoprotein component of BamABCDE complex)